MSIFNGDKLKIDIYGGSHEPVIGVRIKGIEKGAQIDIDELGEFMKRRAPGTSELVTSRKEPDRVEILTGIRDGVADGEEIHAIIRTQDKRSGDYSQFYDTPRPSHADHVSRVKYGDSVNMAGGGQFSGRMTAPLCIAGGIVLQLLRARGITVAAHLYSVGDVCDAPFDAMGEDIARLEEIKKKKLAVIDDSAGERMRNEIIRVSAAGDSIGAVIECTVLGVPIGLGGPLFEGIEGRIASIAFAVPAVKGVEFGRGFSAAKMLGSEHNDPFVISNGEIKTKTNNAGGIVGGISNGMPILFRVGFKPTPSIRREQDSVSISEKKEVKLTIGGRHDPCVALRAVPVVEAVAALAIYDLIKEE